MPRQIALLLCTAFVLFLLRLDRKQFPDASVALWIPTIWMLLAASKPLAIWFGGVGADDEGSLLDRVFLTALFCVGLFVIAKRKLDLAKAMKENAWLMLLISYMFVSISWSDVPFISFKRWVKELTAVVMALLILSEREPRRALESVFRRTIYVLIPFSYILIHYFPEYGREYGRWSGLQMWTGVTLQKNGLARLCMFSIFFIVWTFVRRRFGKEVLAVKYEPYVEVLVFGLALYLFGGPQHSLTQSATATGAMAVTLAVFCWLLWKRRRGTAPKAAMLTVIMTLIITYGTATPFLGRLAVVDVSSSLGRDPTLTDRTEIWAELVPIVMRKPILGQGFGGFWTVESRETHEVSEAHSGYLDILVEQGFVGLLVLWMFLLSSCRKAQRFMSQDFDWGALWICCLVMSLLHNIAESSLNSFTSHLTAVLLFLAVCVPDSSDLAQRKIA